jgi:hypothetical protein
MTDLARTASKAMELAKVYPRAVLGGLTDRQLFERVETCCLFIGYPRSGHSLLGSFVDAHPEAVLAHELDMLKYVHARFGRAALCHLALANSRAFTENGRTWSGYSYAVPGQWQGRFETVRVIGDKHGESTTIRLMLTPNTLPRLARAMRARVRLVHVIRNPYDNIATIEKNIDRITWELIGRRHASTLDAAVAYYFALCGAVALAKERLGDDILDVRHEALVAAPEAELGRVCRFLELEPSAEYLRACAGIVFESPRKTRHDTRWDSRSLDAVARAMERYSFLEGYGFSEG